MCWLALMIALSTSWSAWYILRTLHPSVRQRVRLLMRDADYPFISGPYGNPENATEWREWLAKARADATVLPDGRDRRAWKAFCDFLENRVNESEAEWSTAPRGRIMTGNRSTT